MRVNSKGSVDSVQTSSTCGTLADRKWPAKLLQFSLGIRGLSAGLISMRWMPSKKRLGAALEGLLASCKTGHN